VNSLAHVDDINVRFVIGEHMALIDRRGNIRFFVIEYGDGERCGYLLQPYYNKTSSFDPHLINGISWVADAFAAYGLSKARTKIMGKTSVPLDIATFFLVRGVGQALVNPTITSFMDDLFSKKELSFGYRNIMTDKLIFLDGPLTVSF
jgi:hypothetical protein